jgi:hypothetical protein
MEELEKNPKGSSTGSPWRKGGMNYREEFQRISSNERLLPARKEELEKIFIRKSSSVRNKPTGNRYLTC